MLASSISIFFTTAAYSTEIDSTKAIAKGEPSSALTDAWKKLVKPPSISGYVQADFATFDHENTELGTRAVIRRAQLTISGEAYPDWGYMFSIDDINGDVKLESNYVSYLGWKPATLRFGQFKEFFSMEELTSSNNITFLERALPVKAFAPSYRIGVGINTYGDFKNKNSSYTAAIGLFGQEAGHVTEEDNANQGGALAGRLTYAYYPTSTRLFTIGIADSLQVPDSDHDVVYSTNPESYIAKVTFVNTSQITLPSGEFESIDGIDNARYMNLFDVDAAVILGPFSLQSEYIGTYVNQFEDDSLYLKGWYIFGSWFITGESRNYDKKNAVFTGITPLHSYGAWEVALRYSYINLNDDDIQGGREHNETLGLNWYPNPTVRFMANYTHVHAEQTDVENNPNIYSIRAQVSFG